MRLQPASLMPVFLTVILLAPTALSHVSPWVSPQEFKLPCKQALKARFNRRMHRIVGEWRFQRWRVWGATKPGALLQADDEMLRLWCQTHNNERSWLQRCATLTE